MSTVDETYDALMQATEDTEEANQAENENTSERDVEDVDPQPAADGDATSAGEDEDGELADIQDGEEGEGAEGQQKQNSAFAAMRHTIQDLKRQLAEVQQNGVTAEHQPNVDTYASTNTADNMVYDPDLERYVPKDSFEGVLAMRALAAKQREAERQQMVQAQKFTQRLEREGKKYKNFDESVATLAAIETAGIRAGLLNVERPESVINYLGRHPDALNKLASLNDQQQAVYIGGLHERLKRPAKVASNAPEPIGKMEKGAKGTDNFNPDTATSEQIMRYLQGT